MSEELSATDQLLVKILFDPLEAYLAVNEAMHKAGEDLATAEDMAATMSKVLRVVSDQLAQTQRDLGYADKAAEGYERERNEALEHLRQLLSTIPRAVGCNCSDCDIRREAAQFLKSSEAKLKSEGDGD